MVSAWKGISLKCGFTVKCFFITILAGKDINGNTAKFDNLFVNPFSLLLQKWLTYLLAGWCSATPGSRTPAISPTVPYQFKALLTFIDGFVLKLSPIRCRNRPIAWVGKRGANFEVNEKPCREKTCCWHIQTPKHITKTGPCNEPPLHPTFI